jgi:hypothetical protein
LELSDDIPLIKGIVENLGKIVQYLENVRGTEVKSQFGGQTIPFGAARLKLIELLIISLKANNKKIYGKIVETKLLEVLLVGNLYSALKY